jgi:hypothetical protein
MAFQLGVGGGGSGKQRKRGLGLSVFASSNEMDNSRNERGPQADFVWDSVVCPDLAGSVRICARWNPNLLDQAITAQRLRYRAVWDCSEVSSVV